MTEIEVYDRAAFDRLRTQLVGAGFEPVPDSGLRRWKGPIPSSLASLTTSETMVLRLEDGWPFTHPVLMVKGLIGDHLFGAEGGACLWRQDVDTLEWMTLEGILRRIDELAESLRSGFPRRDLALDLFTTFRPVCSDLLAVFDPTDLLGAAVQNGWSGPFRGRVEKGRLSLSAGSPSARGEFGGTWYFRDRIEAPPRTLTEFRSVLSRHQAKRFDRQCQERRSIAALFCRRQGELDALVLLISRAGSEVSVCSVEPAPLDAKTLLLRSGPDVGILGGYRLAIFGCGAIGSHLALLLGESGTGFLRLVDGDRHRPGNCSRSALGRSQVGQSKVAGLAEAIREHAPWVEVEPIYEAPWTPSRLSELISGIHLAIDATGLAPFAVPISRTAEEQEVPLISAALFRGGAIGRVRRQVAGRDEPIYKRRDSSRFPKIPPVLSGEETAGLEIGCTAPINNAPPTSVVATAARCAQVVIDALCERWIFPQEVVDVYRPLPQVPFDKPGTLLWGDA